MGAAAGATKVGIISQPDFAIDDPGVGLSAVFAKANPKSPSRKKPSWPRLEESIGFLEIAFISLGL